VPDRPARPADRRPTIATLQRLPSYQDIADREAGQGSLELTATRIAGEVGVSPLVVRKDLEAIGVVGRPRRGFVVAEIREAISRTIGSRRLVPVVLVGVGGLGGSLLRYRRFARYGVEIVAGFDTDRRRIGKEIGGKPVLSLAELSAFVRAHGVDTAVLAVPAPAAQEVATLIIGAGIRGILNFAPVRLEVPPKVLVGRIEVAAGLAVLHHRRIAGQAVRQRPSSGEDLLQFNV
jgi:redox-sensing transcriptional repressor